MIIDENCNNLIYWQIFKPTGKYLNLQSPRLIIYILKFVWKGIQFHGIQNDNTAMDLVLRYFTNFTKLYTMSDIICTTSIDIVKSFKTFQALLIQ